MSIPFLRILVLGNQARGEFIATAANHVSHIPDLRQGVGYFARLRVRARQYEFPVDLIDSNALPPVAGEMWGGIFSEVLVQGWIGMVVVDDGSLESKRAIDLGRALAPTPYIVIAAESCIDPTAVGRSISEIIAEALDELEYDSE